MPQIQLIDGAYDRVVDSEGVMRSVRNGDVVSVTLDQWNNFTLARQQRYTLLAPTSDAEWVGPQGPQGPPGPAGGVPVEQSHNPAIEWVITHNKGYKPAIVILDSTDRVVLSEVVHDDENTARAIHAAPFGGKSIAY